MPMHWCLSSKYCDQFIKITDLFSSLEKFVSTKTKELNNKVCKGAINIIKQEPSQINDIIEMWVNAYSKEHIEYQGKDDKNGDEMEFAIIYHALIHSPALETLLQLEHNYSVAVKKLMEQADEALNTLQKKLVLFFPTYLSCLYADPHQQVHGVIES